MIEKVHYVRISSPIFADLPRKQLLWIGYARRCFTFGIFVALLRGIGRVVERKPLHPSWSLCAEIMTLLVTCDDGERWPLARFEIDGKLSWARKDEHQRQGFQGLNWENYLNEPIQDRGGNRGGTRRGATGPPV